MIFLFKWLFRNWNISRWCLYFLIFEGIRRPLSTTWSASGADHDRSPSPGHVGITCILYFYCFFTVLERLEEGNYIKKHLTVVSRKVLKLGFNIKTVPWSKFFLRTFLRTVFSRGKRPEQPVENSCLVKTWQNPTVPRWWMRRLDFYLVQIFTATWREIM